MSGKIYNNYTADGMNYKIYIPDNFNPNTRTLSYQFSAGIVDNNDNYVWRRAIEAIESQGYEDTVVLFPNHFDPRTWQKQYQNNSLAILDDARKKYNLQSQQFMTVGFSSGCSQSVKTTAEYILRNPGVERQITFTQDGFIWKSGVLNETELNALIENDTLVVSYCQPDNKKYISDAVLKNLDTLIITDKEEFIDPKAGYWGHHDQIALRFFEEEFYHNVLDFIDGKGTLDTSRYNFYTSNSDGVIYQINDPNELYELLGINVYDIRSSKLATLPNYVLTSDGAVLANYLNDIRGEIRKSAFLSTPIDRFSGSSDTAVPSQIAGEVAKYFSNVSTVLNHIANFTDSVAKVHELYIETDERLTNMIKGE